MTQPSPAEPSVRSTGRPGPPAPAPGRRPPLRGPLDLPLIGLVMAVTAVLWWQLLIGPGGSPPTRVLVVDGSGRASARPLPPSGFLELDVPGPLGTTVVRLTPDGARIVSSPCPCRVCVATGALTRSGAVAACVPNRILVRIEGGAPGGVDAVSR